MFGNGESSIVEAVDRGNNSEIVAEAESKELDGVSSKLDMDSEAARVEALFTEEQVNTIAIMVTNGYGVKSIVLAAGLNGVSELELAMTTDRVKNEIVGLKSEKVVKDLTVDEEWGEVEEMALESLKFDLKHSQSEMTPMEKLRIAKEANTSKKRSDEASGNGSGGHGGNELAGDMVNGVKQVVNLQMPVTIIQRFRQVSADNGKIIEGEFKKAEEFESVNADNITAQDVQKILDVDVTGDEGAANGDIDRMFSESNEKLFGDIFTSDSDLGISQQEG
jgi:hypothetical protein